MSDWKTFALNDALVGQAQVNAFQNTMDAILTLTNIAIGVLEALKAFLLSFPDPVSAIVSALLAEIQTILDNLRETGAFGLFLIPTTLEEVKAYRGGYPKYRQLFLQSVFDTQDPNRPQVGNDGYLGGLFILVNKGDVSDFLRQVINLASLFRFPELRITYPAPINVSISPATSTGQTPDNALFVFTEGPDLTHLLLSWEEPKFTQDLFYDFYRRNKFYIERSRNREGILLTREKTRQTSLNPIQERIIEDGDLSIIEPQLDRYGNPIYVWEPALDPSAPFVEPNDPNFFSTPLAGSYRYLLSNVEKGIANGYYYRVRSVPASATLITIPSDEGPIYQVHVDGQEWTGSAPSSPVFGALPTVDPTFDLPSALLNMYRAAYLLRFDVDTWTTSGTMIGSSSIQPMIPPFVEDNGQLLYDEGAVIASQVNIPDFENVTVFPLTLFPQGTPTTYSEARREVSLASLTGSRILEDDPFAGAREMFQTDFDRDEAERVRLWIDRQAISVIDSLLPVLLQNESLREMFQDFYVQGEADINSVLTGTSSDFILNDPVRTSVHLLIQTIDRFQTQGTPPNWQSLRLFEDILPEADILMRRLFDMMKAIQRTFEDAASSLDDTIEGLRNRMAILNDIIDFLDDILDFYFNLSPLDFSVSVLFIPPAVGGVGYLTREFMQAGNLPATTPDDFSAGVVLAFGGAGLNDALASSNAARFIFGF